MNRPSMTLLRQSALLIAVGLLARPATAADFAALTKHTPDGANAALFIDVAALKKAPLAEKEGWFDADAAPSGRPWYLPPEAEQVVVTTALDPNAGLTPQWEAAVLGLSAPVDLKAYSQAEGGYVDDFGGKAAVWAPSGAYLVPFGPTVLGELAPANRQAAARWSADAGKGELSPYLASAVGVAGERAPIVMAFDLANVVPPHVVYQTVRASEKIKGDAKKKDQIAKVLASLQGATVIVAVTDDAAATIKFDFAESVTPLAGVEATPFAVLANKLGASVRAKEGWTVKAAGKTVRAHGDLSVSGLRRLLSLIEIPTTKFSSLANEKPAPTQQEVVLKASKQYFDAVTTMFDDLRETLADADGNHALYMERYSRKIDRLPILNVDDALLDWGATIAETLRGGGQTVRGAGLRSGVRKAGAYGAYQYAYDGYGYYYGGQPTENALAEVSRQEGAAARSDVYASWKEMEDHTAQIRRDMTKKYGVEF